MTVKQTDGKPGRVGDGTPGPGRPKGSPNKANAEREAQIQASGLTPLEYMLSVFRDESRPRNERMEAAKAAAPYSHPRLSAVEAKVDAAMDIRAWLMRME